MFKSCLSNLWARSQRQATCLASKVSGFDSLGVHKNINMKKQQIKESIIAMSENEVDAELTKLSETFKPVDNRPFLDMHGNPTLLGYKKTYLYLIWSLKVFLESGKNEDVGKELGITEIFTDV